MTWNNASPLRLADSPTIEPPIRIILHIQSDVGVIQNLKSDKSRAQIASEFFECKGLEPTSIYVHLPSGQARWESQVILDYCTGDILEGSVADQIPFCVYLVSQQKERLTFEKAKATQLTYLNAQIATETFPWKSEIFRENTTDTNLPKESTPQKQPVNQGRRKTKDDFHQRLQKEVSDLEAKLRRNIEDHDPELSPKNNTSLYPNNPGTSTIHSISYLLYDQAIRVLLQISTDNLPGNLRERCTTASKAFAQLMLRSEYPTTKVYRLIRGMGSSSGPEFWMVVDYWIGRSRGTGNPPFLSMSYRGGVQDGIIVDLAGVRPAVVSWRIVADRQHRKFQPTKLSNAAAQTSCSVFLMKFHLNRNGSSVTVEGVEPTGEPDVRDQVPVPEGSGEQIFNLSGISGIPGGSDGVVSGDWVVPDCVRENANGMSAGMSSWEFVGDV